MAPVEELALMDLDRSNKGASKQRRDQINAEIARMRDLLPLPESSRQRLSQLQIMSLTCVYIRKCNTLHKLFRHKSQEQLPDSLDFFQALTGFLLVTTREGKLLFISENVTEYLGHSMVDMKTQGDSLYDIVDKRDHATVKAQLLQAGTVSSAGRVSGSTTGQDKSDDDISFLCRMNMSRTLKRQSGFGDVKVMHVRGHFLNINNAQEAATGCQTDVQSVFMATCTPLITPDIKENLIQSNTMVFKTAHKLDMTFVEVTKTAEYHLGFTTEELSTKSWYSLLHPEDIHEAKEKHVQLIRSNHEMGCMLTVRMLREDGSTFWVNIVMHVRQSSFGDNDDAYIICINQVISSPDEAYQIKMQGHLLTMYPSRAHEIWGNHLTAVATGSPDQNGVHTWIQQDGANAVPVPGYQTNFSRYVTPMSRPQMYPHAVGGTVYPSANVARQSPEMDQYGPTPSLVQSDQLKAMLKRKIQGPTNGMTCKPAKMAKFSVDMNGGSNGGSRYPPAFEHGVAYLDNFLRASQPVASEVDCLSQSVQVLQPCVYRIGKQSPVSRSFLMEKSSSCISSEQVVPTTVTVPDSFLTPDPSPSNSPQPNHTSITVISSQERYAAIKTEVIDPEDNVAQEKTAANIIQALENLVAQPQKAASNSSPAVQAPAVITRQVPSRSQQSQKKRELPIFDAFDIDNFFDTFFSLDDETKASIKVENTVPIKQEIKVEVNEELPTMPALCIPDFARLDNGQIKREEREKTPEDSSPQVSPRSISTEPALLASSQEVPAFSFNTCINNRTAPCSPPSTRMPSFSSEDCTRGSAMASSPASSVSTHENYDDLLSYFSDDGVVSPLQIDSDNCSTIFNASSPQVASPDHRDSSFEKPYFVSPNCSIPFKMESQRRPEELSPGSSISSLAGEDDWMDNEHSTALSLNIALDVVDTQGSDRQISRPFGARNREVLGMPEDLKLDFILDTFMQSQGSIKMIKNGQ